MKFTQEGVTILEHFSSLAARFRGKADYEKNPALKAECERLAECYFKLAKESESARALST
jgi:hypothetical protein